MKCCSKCGALKAIDAFQVRLASHDGLTAACKACLSARDKARESVERAEKRREYQRTDAGRAAHQRALKASAARLPERARARRMFGNAVRDGRVMRWPVCAVYTCSGRPEAHHPDYSRPLDVVWLCNPHHRAAHALTEDASQ